MSYVKHFELLTIFAEKTLVITDSSATSKSPESIFGLGEDTSGSLTEVAGGVGKKSDTGTSVTLMSLSGDKSLSCVSSGKSSSTSVPSDVSCLSGAVTSLKCQAKRLNYIMSAHKGFPQIIKMRLT